MPIKDIRTWEEKDKDNRKKNKKRKKLSPFNPESILSSYKENVKNMEKFIWSLKVIRLKKFLTYIFNFVFIPLSDIERRKKMQDRHEQDESGHQQVMTITNSIMEEFKKQSQKMEELIQRVCILEAENKSLKQENENLRKENEDLRKEITILQKANENLEREVIHHKRKINTLKQENTILKIISVKGDGSSNDDENSSQMPIPVKPQLKINEENKLEMSLPIITPLTNMMFYYYPCRDKGRNENNLKMAAYEGNIDQIRRILDRHKTDDSKKVDIDGRGIEGSLCGWAKGLEYKTPLMIACERGHLETVKFLVKRNANMYLTTYDKKTAFDYAFKNNHDHICNFLKLQGVRAQEATPPMSPTAPRMVHT
jgi:cell division protein FtsB